MNSNPENDSTPIPKPVAPRGSKTAMGLGTGLALGIGFGVVLGILMKNLSVGIAIGLALGAGVGAALEETQKCRTKPKD